MQVGATQHDGSVTHPMFQAGHPSTDEDAAEAADVDQIDADATADEEQLPDDDQMHEEVQEDDDQADDAIEMSMEPREQSGYPADSDDEQRETDGDSPSEQVVLTAETPIGRKGRISESKATDSGVIEISDDSSDGGHENVGVHSVVPRGSINMQHANDSTFLAAVKRQSKVKEGDWTQVRRQSNSGDYGLIDID